MIATGTAHHLARRIDADGQMEFDTFDVHRWVTDFAEPLFGWMARKGAMGLIRDHGRLVQFAHPVGVGICMSRKDVVRIHGIVIAKPVGGLSLCSRRTGCRDRCSGCPSDPFGEAVEPVFEPFVTEISGLELTQYRCRDAKSPQVREISIRAHGYNHCCELSRSVCRLSDDWGEQPLFHFWVKDRTSVVGVVRHVRNPTAPGAQTAG